MFTCRQYKREIKRHTSDYVGVSHAQKSAIVGVTKAFVPGFKSRWIR